jgi:hypothetical protein
MDANRAGRVAENAGHRHCRMAAEGELHNLALARGQVPFADPAQLPHLNRSASRCCDGKAGPVEVGPEPPFNRRRPSPQFSHSFVPQHLCSDKSTMQDGVAIALGHAVVAMPVLAATPCHAPANPALLLPGLL